LLDFDFKILPSNFTLSSQFDFVFPVSLCSPIQISPFLPNFIFSSLSSELQNAVFSLQNSEIKLRKMHSTEFSVLSLLAEAQKNSTLVALWVVWISNPCNHSSHQNTHQKS
jgi:hypothetical protein